MEFSCNSCNKRLISEESLKQHELAKHSKIEKESKSNFRKYVIFSIIGLIIIFSFLVVSSYVKQPGKYDDFAKCLTEKGAIIYGNDFCQYTNKQLNFFGKSGKFLNYIKCSENQELCDSKGIDITPTWEINGKMYKQIQTFESLSSVTGCKV